jgi:DNA invertase Pin-like site-specific DNA recombinase
MSPDAVRRAAIYARISKADSEVDKVENQVKELKKLAKSLGYTVLAVFEDDDLSAYKGSKTRPGWASLIHAIAKNQFDVIMATEMSRFTRGSLTETEYFTATCIKAGAVIHTRAGGIMDPKTPGALAMVKIMDVVSGLEVALKVERQKARNRADLELGKPTKGLRPFGWEKDRVTVKESEARYIRDAYSDILDRGETVWRIAQKWNSAGLKTESMVRPRRSRLDGVVKAPTGIWTSTTVRQVLIRERNAGILMSQGAELPKSLIEPIVTREQWEAVCASTKGAPSPKGPKPQYLLGGLLECVCGARMTASKSVSGKPGKKHSYKIYRCSLYGFDKTSKHVTCQLNLADAVVRDWIVEDIGLGFLEESLFDKDELSSIDLNLSRLADLDTELLATLNEGLGNPAQIRGLMRANKSERVELEAQRLSILSAASQSTALDDFRKAMDELPYLAPDADVDRTLAQGFKAWDELPMESKRAIIKGGYIVKLLAGGRGPDRVLVTQKNPPGNQDSWAKRQNELGLS